MILLFLVSLLLQQPATRPYMERAELSMKAGRTEDAIADYTRAINLRLDNGEAWMRRGKAYMVLMRYRDAAKDFAQAADLSSAPADVLVDSGDAWIKAGESQLAVDQLTRALDSDTGNQRALALRAEAFAKLGSFDMALADLTLSIEKSPKNGQLYLDRADLYDTRGERDKALADRESALVLMPDSADALLARAHSYISRSMPDRALADETEAIRLRPDMPKTWQARAATYFILDRYDEAAADLREALRRFPDYESARELLAKVDEQKVIAEKLAQEKTEQERTDQDKQAKEKLAAEKAEQELVAQKAEQDRLAKEQAERERLAVAPVTPTPGELRNPPAHAEISTEAHYRRGRSFLQQEKFQEAVSEFTAAINTPASHAMAFNSRGFSYFKLRDYTRALVDFDEALRLNPGYANAQLNRAAALKAANRADKKLVGSVDLSRMLIGMNVPAAEPHALESLPTKEPNPDTSSTEVPSAKAAPVAPPAGSAIQHYKSGRALQQERKFGEAIHEFTDAIAAKSNYTLAFNSRGFCYFMLRDYTRALADYDEALRLDPTYANAMTNRAAAVKAAGHK